MLAPIALLSLAAVASAAPAAPATPSVDPCAGLGSSAFATANNFSLAAFTTSIPSANSTGIPLVLGPVDVVEGFEFKALSTIASFPYDQWHTMSLDKGALTVHADDAPDAQAMDITSGKALSFVAPPKGAAPQAFCAVADTDPAHGGLPQLAVNGDTKSFSLCPETTAPGALVNIVYKPSVDAKDYVFDQCTPVLLNLVGLD